MYRSLGSLTTFGVPSGPYSGAPRRLVWSRLPEEVKARLTACLQGRARPWPIAVAVTHPTRVARRLILLAVAGTGLLVALVVRSWPGLQPGWTSLLYALALAPLLALVAFVLQRRVARGGAPVDPGRYLLPLDLITFDREGLTVTPLGGVRDVGVLGKDGEQRLVLRFEGGEVDFSLPSSAHADRTYEALVQAQRTLEVLSYSDDLEEALAQDPFFALRADGGMDSLSKASPRAPGRRVSPALAFGLALLLALPAGHAARIATNRMSDDVRFRRALREGTEEAFERYLAVGGLRRQEADVAIVALRYQRRHVHEVDSAKDRMVSNLALREAISGPAQPENPRGFVMPRASLEWNLAHARCLEGFSARAPSGARSAFPLIVALEDEARRGAGGPARLAVRFARTVSPDALAELPEGLLAAREKETTRALAVVLAEVCPPAVLKVEIARGEPAQTEPEILVRYEVFKGQRTSSFEGVPVPLYDIRFDATVNVWPKKPVGFSLTMPAPAQALGTTRERSVFRIDERASPRARAHGALTARAFDRLYDELYGLFFQGNPRVPLPGFAEVEHIFMR